MRKLLLLIVPAVVLAAAGLPITVDPPAVEMIANSAYGGAVTTFNYANPPATPGPWTVSIVWGASGPTTAGTVSGAGPFTITTDPITLTGGDLSGVLVTVTDTGNAGFGATSGVAHIHDLKVSGDSITPT